LEISPIGDDFLDSNNNNKLLNSQHRLSVILIENTGEEVFPLNRSFTDCEGDLATSLNGWLDQGLSLPSSPRHPTSVCARQGPLMVRVDSPLLEIEFRSSDFASHREYEYEAADDSRDFSTRGTGWKAVYYQVCIEREIQNALESNAVTELVARPGRWSLLPDVPRRPNKIMFIAKRFHIVPRRPGCFVEIASILYVDR